MFKDSSGATTEIAIGGTCDASAGDVTLSGLGLTSSTSASCTGTFSAIVYYSSGTPSFTSDYGAKQISISQNGGATLNTTLFKAATTHTNVALISTATDLEAIALGPENFYILANDIDLATAVGSVNNWTPIAPTAGGVNFQGVFDGNGKTIRNLNTSSGDGLFDLVDGSSTSPAVISNLTVSNASIGCASSACGSVVGTLGQYGSLNYIIVTATLTGTTNSGGIVGASNGSITFVSSNSTVTGTVAVGTVVGSESATGTIAYAHGDGSAQASLGSVGGIAGAVAGTITDSYSSAAINGTSVTRVGGLVGKVVAGASIARCASYGDVSATGSTSSGPGVGLDNQGLSADSILVNSSAACTGCTNSLFTSKTAVELQTKATFTSFSWDFTTPIWTINEGISFPQLYWESL